MRDMIDPVPAATRAIPKAPARQRPLKDGERREWKATGRASAASLGLPDDGDVPVVRVRATQRGYYGWMTRYEGDVFDIALDPRHKQDVVGKQTGVVIYHKGDPVAFSPFWMEPVEAHTPIRITTGPEELKRRNEQMIETQRGGATGDRDVLGR